MYKRAIRGTSFSVMAAIRLTPPRKTKPAMAATITPMIHAGTPKAMLLVSPMELDCTMQPMKPSANVMAIAKNTASTLPKTPGKASWI